ncbi:MAG: hypothetical protein KGS46_04455, partial [Chloroflexi bacterium]|nr:hypothetical protein [Chloroflexota bacterium]
GHLLASRGGLIPALTSAGLNKQESKQTWQAIAQGKWEANQLLAELNTQIKALQHPDFEPPLILIMTNIKLTPDEAYTIFKSRWGIEQPPLVDKQLLGAHRQFVHHPEMCFRLPEFSMIAAVILTYCAACQPACPTGYWDRKPKPTTGHLRRHLSDFDFSGIPLLPRLREKHSVTSHLPTGYHPALALARAQKAVFSEH